MVAVIIPDADGAVLLSNEETTVLQHFGMLTVLENEVMLLLLSFAFGFVIEVHKMQTPSCQQKGNAPASPVEHQNRILNVRASKRISNTVTTAAVTAAVANRTS